MYKHILVPTDFSECGARALDHALEIAAKFDAKITLIHAFMLLVPAYGAGLTFPVGELEREAQKALDGAVAHARTVRPEVTVAGSLVVGEVAAEVLRAAAELKADLIVMGTHGRRGFSRLILGSVAEHVVRAAHIPVLTVSSHEEKVAFATLPVPPVL